MPTTYNIGTKGREYRLRDCPNPAMQFGVDRYVVYGEPQGDFLMALFSNNLMRAVSHADSSNIRLLAEWAIYLYNWMPRESIGSAQWIESRGLDGLEQEAEQLLKDQMRSMLES